MFAAILPLYCRHMTFTFHLPLRNTARFARAYKPFNGRFIIMYNNIIIGEQSDQRQWNGVHTRTHTHTHISCIGRIHDKVVVNHSTTTSATNIYHYENRLKTRMRNHTIYCSTLMHIIISLYARVCPI